MIDALGDDVVKTMIDDGSDLRDSDTVPFRYVEQALKAERRQKGDAKEELSKLLGNETSGRPTIDSMLVRYSYIALEGIDGAGKTVQLARLAQWLEKQGIAPIRLFEPTYGRYGSKARIMISAGKIEQRRKLHELLVLDRKEHIAHKLGPLLNFVRSNPRFVLLQDRCYLSAPAYQGSNDDEVVQLLKEEQSYAPRPDVIVLLRVPPAIAAERLKRKGDHSPFKNPGALARVQARYEFASRDKNENVLVIDGTGSEEEVHARIRSVMEVRHD